MKPVRIVFLVLPRVHLIDFAGPMQVFSEAAGYGANLSMEYCGVGRDVETSTEFPLGKLKSFKEVLLTPGDFLFIPGAEVEYTISKAITSQKDLLEWVRNARENRVNICSVCSGAFFLAVAGVLDGLKCTTHWKRTAELKRRFPSIDLIENVLFVEDDGVYTSAGVTAGIDMSLAILARLTDDSLSFKVAREMVVFSRRASSDPQLSPLLEYRNHINTGIHKIQDYMIGNISKKVSLSQLADEACMSTRSLTRIFKKETGITVNEYTNLIRKTLLRELSRNPDMTRKQMARQCGLTSERQVLRLMKEIA